MNLNVKLKFINFTQDKCINKNVFEPCTQSFSYTASTDSFTICSRVHQNERSTNEKFIAHMTVKCIEIIRKRHFFGATYHPRHYFNLTAVRYLVCHHTLLTHWFLVGIRWNKCLYFHPCVYFNILLVVHSLWIFHLISWFRVWKWKFLPRVFLSRLSFRCCKI